MHLPVAVAATALIIAAPLLVPGVAAGYDVGQDISGQPEIVEALADARAYWGNRVACAAGVAVDVADFADAPEAATALNCHISVGVAWLNASPDRTRFCALFAHEYGHLLGYGHEAHDDDADGVMVNRGVPQYCWTLLAPSTAPPQVCRWSAWPAWARATSKVRRLYFDGHVRKARAAFRAWRKHHPHAKLPGSCVVT